MVDLSLTVTLLFVTLLHLISVQSALQTLTCSSSAIQSNSGDTVKFLCVVAPPTSNLGQILWRKLEGGSSTSVYTWSNGFGGQAQNNFTGRASLEYTPGLPNITLTVNNVGTCDTQQYTCSVTELTIEKTDQVSLTVSDVIVQKEILNGTIGTPLPKTVLYAEEDQLFELVCNTVDSPRARGITWEKINKRNNSVVNFDADETLGSLIQVDQENCTYKSSLTLNITAKAKDASEAIMRYHCIIIRHDGTLDNSTGTPGKIEIHFPEIPTTTVEPPTTTSMKSPTTTSTEPPTTTTTESPTTSEELTTSVTTGGFFTSTGDTSTSLQGSTSAVNVNDTNSNVSTLTSVTGGITSVELTSTGGTTTGSEVFTIAQTNYFTTATNQLTTNSSTLSTNATEGQGNEDITTENPNTPAVETSQPSVQTTSTAQEDLVFQPLDCSGKDLGLCIGLGLGVSIGALLVLLSTLLLFAYGYCQCCCCPCAKKRWCKEGGCCWCCCNPKICPSLMSCTLQHSNSECHEMKCQDQKKHNNVDDKSVDGSGDKCSAPAEVSKKVSRSGSQDETIKHKKTTEEHFDVQKREKLNDNKRCGTRPNTLPPLNRSEDGSRKKKRKKRKTDIYEPTYLQKYDV